MRGSTKKKLDAFVDELIKHTPPEQLTKTRDQLISEMKVNWKKGSKADQKFVDYVVNGKDISEFV